MKTKLVSFAAILFFALLTFSCETDENANSLTTDLEETLFAENIESQISNDVDEAVFLASESASGRFGEGHFGGYGMMGCVTRTVERPEDAEFPITITLVFGSDCEVGNVVKSGTIIITITGPRNEEGSERIVTFEDFYVNGNLIEGTWIHTYLGGNEWTMMMENGQITNEDGQVMTRNVYRHRIMVEGIDTEDPNDDVFEITGNANGVNFMGYTYTKTITNALRKTRECQWIVSGTIETETEGAPNCVIDFGDGTCDNLATRTVDGEEPEQIEMNCRIQHFHRIQKNR